MNATPAGTVHFLVPAGIDDPARVSGGNVFDRRLSAGLSAAGWVVRLIEAGSAEGLGTGVAQPVEQGDRAARPRRRDGPADQADVVGGAALQPVKTEPQARRRLGRPAAAGE